MVSGSVPGPGLGPVQAAIHARRTIRDFNGKPVPRDVTRRLLDAAVQAPNHRRTKPWRFFVVDGDGPVRTALAELSYETVLGRRTGAASDDEGANARAEGKRRDVEQVPLLIIGFSIPGRSPEETRENYAAVACAFQNVLLAAQEEGLAAGWSTGGLCVHPRLVGVLGADSSWELVGALYLGWADPNRSAHSVPRPSAAEATTWATP